MAGKSKTLMKFFIPILAIVVLLSCSETIAKTSKLADSVRLKIYYLNYQKAPVSSSSPGAVFDVVSKKRAIPTDLIARNEISSLPENPKKNNFNGLFFLDDDELISMGGILKQKTGESVSYYSKIIKNSGFPKSFLNYFPIKNAKQDKFNQYAGYILDIIWIKVNFKANELTPQFIERYKKKVPGNDGENFNFYVPKRVVSSSTLK